MRTSCRIKLHFATSVAAHGSARRASERGWHSRPGVRPAGCTRANAVAREANPREGGEIGHSSSRSRALCALRCVLARRRAAAGVPSLPTFGMASASTQVWASVALWAFLFLVACQGVVARIWPGAITGGLKILLALAIAPILLGLLGEKAEKKTDACAWPGCATPGAPLRELRAPRRAAATACAALQRSRGRGRSVRAADASRARGCGFNLVTRSARSGAVRPRC